MDITGAVEAQHGGAEVGQQHAAERHRADCRHLDDAQASERATHPPCTHPWALGFHSATGRPAFFQSPMPPWIWSTFSSPISFALLAASDTGRASWRETVCPCV